MTSSNCSLEAILDSGAYYSFLTCDSLRDKLRSDAIVSAINKHLNYYPLRSVLHINQISLAIFASLHLACTSSLAAFMSLREVALRTTCLLSLSIAVIYSPHTEFSHYLALTLSTSIAKSSICNWQTLLVANKATSAPNHLRSTKFYKQNSSSSFTATISSKHYQAFFIMFRTLGCVSSNALLQPQTY